jgi:hypothetical protein
MRCNRHGQMSKDFAPETVAHPMPAFSRLPILTIKSSLSISLSLKRDTGGRLASFPGDLGAFFAL